MEKNYNNDVLYVPPEERVSLSVQDLTVTIDTSSRLRLRRKDVEQGGGITVIDGLSFHLPEGKILAILGESGSGKTTLLNTLSQRTKIGGNFRCSGSFQFEATRPLKQSFSYLIQEDFFLPNLTVEETLRYAAALKVSSKFSAQQRNQLVDDVIRELDLSRLANDIVCDSFGNIKFSGGERRLLSLALQLLNKPSVIFLDEPTTGLDANNSQMMVSALRKLAYRYGITMVLTIHQPRVEILKKIDHFTILAKGGRAIYYGDVPASVDYFGKLGFAVPENVNLTDFLVDLSVGSEKEFLVENWKENQPSISGKEKPLVKLTRKRTVSFWREVYVLTHRTLKLSIRDTSSLITLHAGLALMAIVCGWIFYKPPHDLGGVRTITSQLYVMLEVLGFVPMMVEIVRLWDLDGKIFFREKNEGIVSVEGFIISRRLAKFWIEDFIISLIFSLITYFMWGLRVEGSPSYFLIYFANALLVHLCGIGCALLCFALGRDFATSGFYSNFFYQLQNSACGYFINARTMPVYVRWVKYIAYFWYSFGSITANQFTGWEGDCDGENCTELEGSFILDTLGYPEGWTATPIGILVCWFFGFLLLSWFVLKYNSKEVSVSKPRRSKIPVQQNLVDATPSNAGKVKADIRLSNVNLYTVPTPPDFGLFSILWRCVFPASNKNRKLEKHLLNDISINFKPCQVNAIMGPSGSGKTTLLNLIAGRLGFSSHSEGDILLNGHKLENLYKVCSYVMQHDSHIIPTLTVRETLMFQARLRVKDQSLVVYKVDSLIRKLKLSDCANIPIGNEFLKGISGGQRKRVSIAIQLLNDPQILLLDEPTSGLDSNTSEMLLSLLSDLASQEHKTIILTVHQPKYELFSQFGQVALMTRGGRLAFNGTPQKCASHFKSLNFTPAPLVNLADYLLDTVSQQFDEASSVAADRVSFIISSWNPSPEPITVSPLPPSNTHQRNGLAVVSILCHRQFVTWFRSFEVLTSRLLQVFGLCIVHGLFFSPLRNTYEGINNRLGLIQEILNLYYVGFINNISVYPMEREYFIADFEDNLYSSHSFLAAYTLAEIPFEIISGLVFSVFIVLVIGLPRTAAMFFTTFFASFIAINCGESIGILFNSLFTSLNVAVNSLANVLIIGIFMAGTMSINMPPFFQAWNWINPMKYAVGVMANLGFKNQSFECGQDCLLSTGDDVLTQYNLHANYSGYMGALAVCVVVYRLVGWLAVYVRFELGRRAR